MFKACKISKNIKDKFMESLRPLLLGRSGPRWNAFSISKGQFLPFVQSKKIAIVFVTATFEEPINVEVLPLMWMLALTWSCSVDLEE